MSRIEKATAELRAELDALVRHIEAQTLDEKRRQSLSESGTIPNGIDSKNSIEPGNAGHGLVWRPKKFIRSLFDGLFRSKTRQ